ncbi:DUF4931 domain-containing protein [Verrucomicrobium sp. GAS474]|uniref:galactose-1-phosphate uridylyltransferase n=1 Tax=Verrucomicrobium sp. GAS474 TaxID=1882831 RepID=UPI000B890E1B|nr:DUF4931 domain-containing protein [Verrucomicrobium sp. GAS474]
MPELRRDPLVGRWVVFSPERKQRPQDFHLQNGALPELGAFTWGNEHLTPPEVYATRPEGAAHGPNGPGWQVRVVPNRFPALRIEGDLMPEGDGIYDRMNGIGAHEVIIETADAALALEDQPVEAISGILKAYRSRIVDLSRDSRFRSILIFKNVGPMAGASLRHAHSQLIALPVVPRMLQDRLTAARAHYASKERNLFDDLIRAERKEGKRVVHENNGFVAFCPYASRFPFELCLLPRRQNPHFHHSTDSELDLAAESLKQILQRLAKGVGKPDYNLILHTAPFVREASEEARLELDFRWHIEVLPRLTGIAGFEFGTGFFINSTLPEEAAQFLRAVKI